MIEWKKNEVDNPRAARVEAYRAIAEQLETFVGFIKIASVGGMCLTACYFILKIVRVF